MKPPTILIAALLYCPLAQGQVKYYYDFFHDVMDANQKVTYVNYVWETPLIAEANQERPLTPEEGGDGYVAEAYIDYNLPIFQKRVFQVDRKDDVIRPFLGYSRFRLNYGFNVRIANAPSSPILPPTNRFGFAYDFPIFFKTQTNNITSNPEIDHRQESPGFLIKFKKFASARFTENADDANVHFWYGTIFLNHYSNGQNEGVLIDGFNRNDYLSGDFSTNHLRVSMTYNIRTKRRYLWSFNLGYQRELELDGSFLTLMDEQRDARYGLNRLNGHLQYRSGLFKIIKHKYLYSMLRFEWETILDQNLENYPYDNKYRFNFHVFYKLSHLYVRSASLIFHYYWGRDYLNIRYDNPIQSIQVGLSFEFNQWVPPIDKKLADKEQTLLK